MCEKANKKDSLWSKPITWFVIFTAITFVMTGFLFYNINAIHQDYKTQYKNFVEQIQKENPNAKITIINPTKPEDDFQKNFYTTQSNWLNAWIMLLALIFGVMGVAFPLLFTIKKKEIDDILKKSKKRLKDIEKRADEKLEQLEKAQKLLEKINKTIQEHDKCINETKSDLKELKIKYTNIESYERTSTQNDNEESILYFSRGNEFAEENKDFKAIKAYKMALKLNPNFEPAKNNLSLTYNNLGATYGEERKHTEAIAYLKKAIKINPNYEDAYYNMGISYVETKNHQQAIECYKKAIELNPNFTDCYYNLVEAYIFNKQPAEALLALETFKEKEANPWMMPTDREPWENALKECPQGEAVEKIREIIAALPDKN